MYLSSILLVAGYALKLATSTAVTTGQSNALSSVLSKLTDHYHSSPNVTAGLFDQGISPWWESGSIFEVGISSLGMEDLAI